MFWIENEEVEEMNKNFNPLTLLEIKGLAYGSMDEYTRLRELWLGRKRIAPKKYEEFLSGLPELHREAVEYLTRTYH